MDLERSKDEFKHVCRLCNKKYPSGKSLGGHMRSHVMADARRKKHLKKVSSFSAENEHSHNDDDDEDEDDHNDDGHGDENVDGGRSGYRLRENPRKTWRLIGDFDVNINNNVDQKCKQCGKGFQSMKALCGHMSIHSEKERDFKEVDDDGNGFYSWSSDCNGGSGGGGGAGSCSNQSMVDQIEPEEVAMCLMMLSRDSSGSKNWCNFETDSSDNNSVIVTLSSKDRNEENSDSGYFENGAMELESDDSVDGFPKKNYSFEKSKYDFEARLVDSLGEHHARSRKRKINDVGKSGFDSKNMKQGHFYSAKKVSSSKKVKGHKCPYCPKVFKSGQALGGHKRIHMLGSSNNVDGRVSVMVPTSKPEIKHPLLDLNLPAPVEEDA